MIILLSPAKSLDTTTSVPKVDPTQPVFIKEAKSLVKELRQFDASKLSSLMHMSAKLGELNQERYKQWRTPFNRENSRPAIYTFIGDVYQGLQAMSFDKADIKFAQSHLRILSGLYGILKPLDLIQPYRLEMGTHLSTGRGKNLYDFWGSKLTAHLSQELAAQKSPVIVNLASSEYFTSIQAKALDAEVVTPVFKDFSNGKYRFLSFYAKQARGMMAAFLIKQRVDSIDSIKAFSDSGYKFSAAESEGNKLVFLRKKPPSAAASGK